MQFDLEALDPHLELLFQVISIVLCAVIGFLFITGVDKFSFWFISAKGVNISQEIFTGVLVIILGFPLTFLASSIIPTKHKTNEGILQSLIDNLN